MKIDLHWNGAMKFTSVCDGHEVQMDTKTPIGQNTAMTPKELVAAGLGGCTAMDVVALFKKNKQTVDSFDVSVDVEKSSSGYPQVFTHALITYVATGNIDKDVFIKAATDSQTKYCGVSAMLSKAFPIHYKLILNGETIHEAQSHFGETK